MQEKLYPKRRNKSNSECPQCGFKIYKSHQFEQVLSGRYDNPGGGCYEAVRETPTRAFALEPDVLVPAAQSLVSAVVTAIPALAVSMVMRWDWSAPIFVAAATVAVSWFAAISRIRQSASIVESFSYAPPENSDGQNSSPKTETGIRLDVYSKDDDFRAAIKIVNLPTSVSGKEFREFCNDVLAGKSLARKDWTPVSKGFSRDVYDQLIASMIEAGLVNDLGATGKKISVGGRHAIRRMIREGNMK